MDKLNCNNYFSTYALHPFSNELSSKDQLKATVATVAATIFSGCLFLPVVAVYQCTHKSIQPVGQVQMVSWPLEAVRVEESKEEDQQVINPISAAAPRVCTPTPVKQMDSDEEEWINVGPPSLKKNS